MREGSRSQESVEAENARLKARITELERERFYDDAPRQSRTRSESRFSDVSSHAARTADNVTRGMVYAFIEQLQSGVDVMNTIADEFFSEPRTRSRGASLSSDEDTRYDADEFFSEPRTRRRSASLSSDEDEDIRSDDERRSVLSSGLAEGIHESLEIPHRVARRFFEELDAPRESERYAGQRITRRDRGRPVRRESTEVHKRTPSGTSTKIETETKNE